MSVGAHRDTIVDRRYPFVVEPIAVASRDSAIDAHLAHWREIMPDVVPDYQNDAYIPSAHPPLRGLAIGNDSTIWIRLRDTRDWDQYIVLDERGDVVGRTIVSENLEVRYADADYVWPIVRDELDVESIIRMRIQR